MIKDFIFLHCFRDLTSVLLIKLGLKVKNRWVAFVLAHIGHPRVVTRGLHEPPVPPAG